MKVMELTPFLTSLRVGDEVVSVIRVSTYSFILVTKNGAIYSVTLDSLETV